MENEKAEIFYEEVPKKQRRDKKDVQFYLVISTIFPHFPKYGKRAFTWGERGKEKPFMILWVYDLDCIRNNTGCLLLGDTNDFLDSQIDLNMIVETGQNQIECKRSSRTVIQPNSSWNW